MGEYVLTSQFELLLHSYYTFIRLMVTNPSYKDAKAVRALIYMHLHDITLRDIQRAITSVNALLNDCLFPE